MGISPASLQELFEVFGMADQTLGREFSGVGLGLGIPFIRNIVNIRVFLFFICGGRVLMFVVFSDCFQVNETT